MLSFVIPGPPRTKKNHGFRTKQGHSMPSKAYMEWNKQAQIHLMLWRKEQDQGDFPLVMDVNCRALIFVKSWDQRGDAVGYYQGLADALQEGGIVENDRLISSWDGSRVLLDKANPRIEIELRLIL